MLGVVSGGRHISRMIGFTAHLTVPARSCNSPQHIEGVNWVASIDGSDGRWTIESKSTRVGRLSENSNLIVKNANFGLDLLGVYSPHLFQQYLRSVALQAPGSSVF